MKPPPHVRWAEGLLVIAALLLLPGLLPSAPAGADLPSARELLHRVDLNRAPWHELANLPGIGAVRAREIVADRRANGPFAGPADLARVPGIGPVTVERVRAFARGGGR